MCFSATASFVASGALAVTGGASVVKVKKWEEYFLAAVPFLFAVQQFLEGLVWLSIGSGNGLTTNWYAAYGFLFFAFVVWPTWVPLTAFLLEPLKKRKLMMLPFLGVGISMSAFLVYVMLTDELFVKMEGSHLHYIFLQAGDFSSLENLVYVAAVVVAPMLSSRRFGQVAGVLVFALYVIASLVSREMYVSVWCFYAAVLSLGVLCWFRRK